MTDTSPLPQQPFLSQLGRVFSREQQGNVDILKALFCGVLLTALFYEVFPVPFMDQPWLLSLFEPAVSEVITGMSFWCCFLLFFKYLRHRSQLKTQQAFALQPSIQAILAQDIYARNAEAVLAELDAELRRLKVKKFNNSTMYRRIAQVLRFVTSAPKKESVNDLLGFQAQIDIKKMEAGFTPLQVFIWAIPILGFIGTVWGIGDAVRSFSEFIQTAEGGNNFNTQMRAALGGVTSGLAVAFNTTFLALLLVIPVMVLTSFLQKHEEEGLLFVEEFCLKTLLPYLHILPSLAGGGERFDDHMHRIMQLSENWLGQLEPLVQRISEQTEMVSHQLGGVQPLVQAFTDRLLATPPAPSAPIPNPWQAAPASSSAAPSAAPSAAAKTATTKTTAKTTARTTAGTATKAAKAPTAPRVTGNAAAAKTPARQGGGADVSRVSRVSRSGSGRKGGTASGRRQEQP